MGKRVIVRTSALTAEQVAHAWRLMRKPRSWPPSLDAVLADGTRRKCIESFAASLLEAAANPEPPPPPAPPAPTAPPFTRPLRVPHTRAGTFDPRRAAANDKDD